MRSVLVIGAGVVGVSTAYALARRGLSVTLVDREHEAGRGTSFANGAQLSYIYTDALANPSLLRRVPGLLLGLDPAFRMRLRFDFEYWQWQLRFLANMPSKTFREHTLAGMQLGLESRAALQKLLEKHPLEFSHSAAGKLHIYDDAQAFAATQRLVDLKRLNGAEQQRLTPQQACDIEPALRARSKTFAGAVYSPQEEVGDPYRFCNALLGILKEQYAVQVRFGMEIARLEVHGGQAAATAISGERLEADAIVLCAGMDSRRFLKDWGLGGLLVPMKGYSFNAPAGTAAPRVSITDVSRKLVLCSLNGGIRVAGRAELGARDAAVVPSELAQVVRTARDILPQALDYSAVGSGWAGLRAMSPSSLPVIRCVSSAMAVNVGHGMLGWTFAMGSAERLASMLLDENKKA